MFFIENHGDDSMGRCKMRLIMWFISFWILFLGFPYILGGIGNKISKFGSHVTEFGRACIDRTQNLRKCMKSTWVMNKSLFRVFIDEMRPFNSHTIHIQPSPCSWSWSLMPYYSCRRKKVIILPSSSNKSKIISKN